MWGSLCFYNGPIAEQSLRAVQTACVGGLVVGDACSCDCSGDGSGDGTDLFPREETLAPTPGAAQSSLPGSALGAGLGRGCAGC